MEPLLRFKHSSDRCQQKGLSRRENDAERLMAALLHCWWWHRNDVLFLNKPPPDPV